MAKNPLQFQKGLCYRFNRRLDLAAMPQRPGRAAACIPPMPHRLFELAEVHW